MLSEHCSEWLPVTSVVLHGSVLEPILFMIYINNLESGLKCFISISADDTKVRGKALTTADCELVQKELVQMIQWSEKRQCPSK